MELTVFISKTGRIVLTHKWVKINWTQNDYSLELTHYKTSFWNLHPSIKFTSN